MNANRRFMSNHNHTEDSNFRLKDCIIRAEDIINRAIEVGYAGVSVTDHETVSSHVRVLQRYQYLKKLHQKYKEYIVSDDVDGLHADKDVSKELSLLKNMSDDFILGLGNEIYLIDDMADVKENYKSGITRFWHFILIAKNAKGYEQIKRISSESAWNNWFKHGKMERVPTVKRELEEIIGKEKGNIIATTACLGGELPNYMLSYFRDGNAEAKRKVHNFVTWGIDVFGKENFFIELQPTLEIPQDDIMETHPQIIFNQNAIKIAKAYDLGYIFATDSHYLKKEHRMVHEAFLRADEDNSSNRELGDFYATTYMMDIDEMNSLLSSHLTEEEIDIGFTNTMKIHSLVEDYDLSHSVIVPRDKKIPNVELKHVFKEFYTKYQYVKKFAESDDVQEKYLLYMIERSIITRRLKYKDSVVARLDLELGEIWSISEKIGMRLATYYVLVQRIINEIMWKVSYVGVARGSVTGFLLAYAIGITQMNPMKYNLPHWRHLSSERPELPDIDVDSESAKRQEIFALMKEYFGKNNVLNTLTLRTEGSKSCCLTACKGWGLDNDTAQAISDMIPFERGANWSLKECFEGNKEKGRAPITEFKNEISKYDGLKEIMLLIEGLVSGRSIHASAVYIFDNGYLVHNSKMKAPNGTDITAYNMHDSDWCGALKFDCLTILGLDKQHIAVDLLVAKGVLEDQGSIKATYDKYIHPDVIDYTDKEMWRRIGENEIIDAFQFDTPVGSQTVKKVKPHTLTELATANSLMRLMPEHGEESPIDTYIKYKNDISLWYKEMRDFGLTEDEIKVLEPHLLPVYGVAETQEVVMRLSMDKNISNFNVAEANMIRKSIAKKKEDVLENARQLFFKKGQEAGTSDKLLKYVWYVQFKKSFGYSFSQNHTFPYSAICLQEMNLACKYDKIFWNTACLTVNAGADENNDNNKTTNYGKIAKAISEIQSKGQKIELPNINKAKFGFEPDMEEDEIIFGLKGICGVGDDIATAIINNQPYKDFDDFMTKMDAYKNAEKENKFGDSAVITLIKAGCFDKLVGENRVDIMKNYIRTISKPLKSLRMDDIQILNELELLTKEQQEYEFRLYKFRKYVYSKHFFAKQVGKSPNTAYYRLETQHSEPYFFEHFETNMQEGKDYEYDGEGYILVKRGSLDREFDKLMSSFKEKVMQSQEKLNAVNEKRFENMWKEKVEGNISKWEMDSLSFYYHDHELAHVKKDDYAITDFTGLPEVPIITEHYVYRGKIKPRFKLTRICGTVLDKDKNKHTISLLTPTGVVTVKFYKGQFGFYDKQISEQNEDATGKTVLEKSWFGRGNLLLVTGYRRQDQFVPKKYSDSAYRHTLQLIKEIDDEGNLKLQSDRVGETSE
jgi:DNA polymerase-3 subunit alpha